MNFDPSHSTRSSTWVSYSADQTLSNLPISTIQCSVIVQYSQEKLSQSFNVNVNQCRASPRHNHRVQCNPTPNDAVQLAARSMPVRSLLAPKALLK